MAEKEPSLREFIEQRITLETNRISSEIMRIDKAVEVFRDVYEERHEALRQEARDSADRAVVKAEGAAELRFQSVLDLRHDLNQVAAAGASKLEVEYLEKRLQDVSTQMTRILITMLTSLILLLISSLILVGTNHLGH